MRKPSRGIGALGGAVAEEPVAEARRVAHQVLDRRRDRGRHARRLAGGDAEVGERGDELGDRLVEPQQAAFHQHQRRDGDDRLRHRVDAPDGVVGQRIARGDVAKAGRVGEEIGLAAADEQRSARDRTCRDIRIEPPGGGGETVAIEDGLGAQAQGGVPVPPHRRQAKALCKTPARHQDTSRHQDTVATRGVKRSLMTARHRLDRLRRMVVSTLTPDGPSTSDRRLEDDPASHATIVLQQHREAA